MEAAGQAPAIDLMSRALAEGRKLWVLTVSDLFLCNRLASESDQRALIEPVQP